MSKKQNEAGAPPKKSKKKWIIIGAIAVVLIGCAAAGGNDSEDKKPESTNSSTSESTTEAPAESTTAAPESTTAPEETAAPTTEAKTEPPTEATTEAPTEQAEPEYKLEFGELLSVVTNDFDGEQVLVVKAKIKPSTKNKTTIDQNYYNVADLIQKQGCDSFDEIQYWAVADMTDGSEQKVVAFTVGSDLIKKIADDQIPANQLGDYVDDLYILPSLKN